MPRLRGDVMCGVIIAGDPLVHEDLPQGTSWLAWTRCGIHHCTPFDTVFGREIPRVTIFRGPTTCLRCLGRKNE